ncbi:translation initiation factor IF-2-like [Dipodomys spectabilis]|uniref:translation initiation factor IF-2-like n=1 Tax=Dipodomys spectabilis TaxID=105255 RepID=UPI001C545959|nr:translation initiation factor IF-2-like [Dipodomys spectabilis]
MGKNKEGTKCLENPGSEGMRSGRAKLAGDGNPGEREAGAGRGGARRPAGGPEAAAAAAAGGGGGAGRGRRGGPGSPARVPALGAGGRAAAPQLPAAADSGGLSRGVGTAGGGRTAPRALASLRRSRRNGDPADGPVHAKRDMAARLVSPRPRPEGGVPELPRRRATRSVLYKGGPADRRSFCFSAPLAAVLPWWDAPASRGPSRARGERGPAVRDGCGARSPPSAPRGSRFRTAAPVRLLTPWFVSRLSDDNLTWDE